MNSVARSSRYVLPDLPYDYGALEPHLSAKLMHLHHDRHHRGYVEAANRTFEKLAEAREQEEFGQISGLERALAFNVSGHVLHSIFWQNLVPRGGGRPQGELAKTIEADFGSFQSFKLEMVKAASTIMGSGWAALVWDPIVQRLAVAQVQDHQSQISQAGIPLLVMDAWEHAYYLQYETDKARYLEALWNLWNWEDVAKRLSRAAQLDLALGNVSEREGSMAPK